MNLNLSDYLSLSISLAALVFSFFTYFNHEKKLKDAQLRQLKYEEDENSKACIYANVVKIQNGYYLLKVFNRGKAKARNIRVELLNNRNAFHFSNWRDTITMLSPSQYKDIKFFVSGDLDSPDIHLKFIWDDDYSINRTSEEFVPFK